MFDAVASLINITQINNYQGEAAMKLESYADINNHDIYEIDYTNFADNSELLKSIVKDINQNVSRELISSK